MLLRGGKARRPARNDHGRVRIPEVVRSACPLPVTAYVAVVASTCLLAGITGSPLAFGILLVALLPTSVVSYPALGLVDLELYTAGVPEPVGDGVLFVLVLLAAYGNGLLLHLACRTCARRCALLAGR